MPGDQRVRRGAVALVGRPTRRLAVRLIADVVGHLDLIARSISRLVSSANSPPGPAISSPVLAPASSSSITSSLIHRSGGTREPAEPAGGQQRGPPRPPPAPRTGAGDPRRAGRAGPP